MENMTELLLYIDGRRHCAENGVELAALFGLQFVSPCHSLRVGSSSEFSD